jgi:hypothetical protein
MVSNVMKMNLTDEEVESIGTGFSSRYYDALAGEPNRSALRRFYNDRSKYVVMQRGRPDYEMKSLLLIGRFVKRMGYSECTVTIRSVITAVRPTAELVVLSVGELLYPGNMVPRKFTQSFVIKRVPWTAAEYQIVEMVFRYDNDTVDHRIPIAVNGTPVVAGPKRNDTAVVSDEKATGKLKCTPANRVGKSNVTGGKSMTSTVPVVGSLAANGKVDGKSCSSRSTHSRKLALVTVSVTGNPIMKVKPVMKVNLSSKGAQSLIAQMYCENRTRLRNA